MESRNAVLPGWHGGRADGSGHARCCHHARSRPVDPFVFRFVAFEDFLEREMGKPCLFALIKEQGFLRRWEVFLAAPWAESDPDGARRMVERELVSWLPYEERVDFSGVTMLRTCDPFVCSLLERFEGHELVHELRPMVIEEVAIERAFIINSCCAE